MRTTGLTTKSDGSVPVAIVGGGFSGTMVAANLARRGIHSVVIEAERRAGLGSAFSTTDPVHLLNIPAETMGAWADEPGDFSARAKVAPGTYAERRRFGEYLAGILEEARASGLVRVIENRAVGASRNEGRWRISLEGGGELNSDALVLASGNQPPAKLPLVERAGRLVIDDPWSERARAAIEDAAARQVDVLILGTSLTMIDVVLSLDSAGHSARTVALSRRGKLPLSNGVDAPAPVDWAELPGPDIRDIARWLRRRSRAVGWRAAVDSLRPHSNQLWRSLPLEQKRLFIRHGRPWWDIHRHRVAPQVARRIDELVGEGRVEVVAGRLETVEVKGDTVEAGIRRRGEQTAGPPRRFGYIFNCTGPLHDIGRTRDPLLRQLLDEGLVRADDLGIGLQVDARAKAQGSDRLWALGALTKGRYWEMIAVPDIRNQAADVAADIATELGHEPDA